MKVLILISAILFISLQGVAQKGCNAVFVKPVHVRQHAPAKQLKPVQKKLDKGLKAGTKIIAKAEHIKQNGYAFFITESALALNLKVLNAERIRQTKPF